MPLTDEEKKAKDLAKREEFWPKFLEEVLAHQKGLWADEGLSPAEMEAEIPIYVEELRGRFEVDWEKTGILRDIEKMFIHYGRDKAYARSYQQMVDIRKITIPKLEELKSDLEELLQEPKTTEEELEAEIECVRHVPKMNYKRDAAAYIERLKARAAALKAEVKTSRQVVADVKSGKLFYDPVESTFRHFVYTQTKRRLEETQNSPPDDDSSVGSSAAELPPPPKRRMLTQLHR